MAERITKTGRKIEMLWDCPYCGTKQILARNKDCPNCGRTREGGTYLGKDIQNRVLSEEDKKLFTNQPDWYCNYCGSMNASNLTTCKNCGSAKEESNKDYFDRKQEQIQKGEIVDDTNKKYNKNGECIGTIPRIKQNHVSESVNENYNYNKNSWQDEENDILSIKSSKISSNKNKKTRNFSHSMKQFITFSSVVLFSILTILLIVKACTPKDDILDIQEMSWERTINIDIEKTFQESGWALPSGARLLYTQMEWHHDEDVFDHYDTVEVTKYKTEKVGTEEYFTYEEAGDGTVDEIRHERDVYGEVPYTDTEQVPVYKKVPVEQLKYYYEIDKMVHSRSVTSLGANKEPYWKDFSLRNKEKEANRSSVYSIKAYNSKGELKTYHLDYDVWNSLNVGDTIHAKVHITGYVELLDENGNVISTK